MITYDKIISKRLRELPPYLFAEIDKKKEELKRKGFELIDLSIGDPDMPTPKHIVEAICKAAKNPENHRYPSYEGKIEFREAVAKRFKEDFNVKLDAEKEVIALIGSKEGIHNIHLALLDSEDYVIVPDPCYPVYKTAPILVGAKIYEVPLKRENNFLPNLEEIPERILRKTKIFWINYPNNPTASVANEEFYKHLVDLAHDYNFIICSDEAYIYITFDGFKHKSILEIRNAKDVSIVFGSLSKTYNMTGWRIGYAVGNADVIKALRDVKTNIDSGVANMIQDAAIVALTSSQECVKQIVETYKKRRDFVVDNLREIGFDVEKPLATFYIWLRVNTNSIEFAKRLLNVGVVVTPGVGFGRYGEGYVRISLTQPEEKLKEAMNRIKKISAGGGI